MTTTHPDDNAYAVFSGEATLIFRRRLPGPVDRVWAYLADSELRGQWLASGDMEPRSDSSFELVWRNDDLSHSPSERPAGFPEVSRAICQLTEIDPPRMLRFTWPGVGDVTVQLQAVGDEVDLTLTHRGYPEGSMKVMLCAGWHTHLDILVARVRGVNSPSFWATWQALQREYEQRLAA